MTVNKTIVRQFMGVVALAAILVFPALVRLLPTQTVVQSTSSYSYTGDVIELDARPDICSALDLDKSLEIKIDGTINKLINYQNLFQTDDENRGMRLEINEAGVWGLLIASSSKDGYDVVVGSTQLQPGPFSMTIQITDGREVGIVTNQIEQRRMLESLNPTCNSTTIGTGYDSSRKTDGSIEVSFTLGEVAPRFVPTYVVDMAEDDVFRTIVLGFLTYLVLMTSLNLGLFLEARESRHNEEQTEAETCDDARERCE